MRALIYREFDVMVNTWREAIRMYALVSIGYVLVMWIMGPRVIGFVDVEVSSLSISVLGFTLAGGRMMFNLERDKTNRQQTFLQTLPISKTNIVHAKFISFLLLCGFTFVLISALVLINVFMNNARLGYWLTTWLITSMFVFITAAVLLYHFLWGTKRIGLISLVALVVWVVIFMTMTFVLISAGASFNQIMGLGSIVSLVIYFVCWWAAVLRVRRKGFPREESNGDEPYDLFTDGSNK